MLESRPPPHVLMIYADDIIALTEICRLGRC